MKKFRLQTKTIKNDKLMYDCVKILNDEEDAIGMAWQKIRDDKNRDLLEYSYWCSSESAELHWVCTYEDTKSIVSVWEIDVD